jgi:hypothetical protein
VSLSWLGDTRPRAWVLAPGKHNDRSPRRSCPGVWLVRFRAPMVLPNGRVGKGAPGDTSPGLASQQLALPIEAQPAPVDPAVKVEHPTAERP